jgi:preprotein translocase subunit SecE
LAERLSPKQEVVGSIPAWPALIENATPEIWRRFRHNTGEKMPEKNRKIEKKPNAITRWWRETIGELRKVTWPTPQEAWRLTKVVIVTMIMMSALLGLLDFVFTRLVAFILS